MDKNYIESRKKEFMDACIHAIQDDSFVKITLGNYQGDNPRLKKMIIKIIELKGEDCFHVTYRYKVKDQVKNVSITEGYSMLLATLSKEFKVGTLFTQKFDLIFTNLFEKKITIKKKDPSHTSTQNKSHDVVKNRMIDPSSKYLQLLQVTNKEGQVYKSAQNKFKQINHFISLVEPRLKTLDKSKVIRMADMGSGKGYLTFALYDFLTNTLKLDVEMTGVEMRPDMVELCNQIATSCSFEKLKFIQSSIEDFKEKQLDVLIALHACDTATDDAIALGIHSGVKVILTAPCCHKQIRRQLEKNKVDNDLSFLTKYGTFLERQAEMVTDGIRTLLLEYFGYQVKVLEFVSDEHTPKNVMITAEKKSSIKKEKWTEIEHAMNYFNIQSHHLLERLKNEIK